MIMPAKVNRVSIFTDADNTLWDTDKVFATAQLRLLENIETSVGRTTFCEDRLAFVRELDQLIAEKHHARLRYPPRLLVTALALALAGVPPKAAVKSAWSDMSGSRFALDSTIVEEIEKRFIADLKSHPSLRDGVRDGLPALSDRGYNIVVFTEGSREKSELILKRYELQGFVDQIFEGPKNVGSFRRLARLYSGRGIPFVVGDQLDRDIEPAKRAGLVTIYFPGGFRPKWENQNFSVTPDYCIDSFMEIDDVIREYAFSKAASD